MSEKMNAVKNMIHKLKKSEYAIQAASLLTVICTLPVYFNWHYLETEFGAYFIAWREMQFNTALGYSLTGIALLFISLKKPLITKILSSFVIVLSSMTLFEYLFGINLRIDQLFREAQNQTFLHPGRMSLNTAISLMACSLSALFLSKPKTYPSLKLTCGIMGALSLELGLLKIISTYFGFPGALDPNSFLHVSFPTAIATSLSGSVIIGIVIQGFKADTNQNYRLKPFYTVLGLFTLILIIWQILLNQEMKHVFNVINKNVENIKSDTVKRLETTSLALKRFATRIEYLGARDKKYIELDAISYLTHIPILRRIGLIGRDNRVYWSYPYRLSKQVENFDQSINPTRKEALEDTVKTRKPSMSSVLDLRSNEKGFLVPVALYQNNHHIGYFYSTVIADKLFEGIVKPDLFYFTVSESGSEIFSNYDSTIEYPFSIDTELSWGKADLKIKATPTAKMISQNKSLVPTFFLFGGTLISIILGLFFQNIALYRRKQNEYSVSLEKALDSAQTAEQFNTYYKLALDKAASVAFTDSEGKITYVNKMFCENSKYSEEELIGKDHRIIRSDIMSNEFFKEMWETISSGKQWNGEICNKAKDGSLYWVDTTIVPFLGEDGSIKKYIAIRREISSRKKLEAELWKTNEFQKAILASANFSIISTDLNGVINSFNSMAEKLLGYSAREVIGKQTPAIIHEPTEVVKRAEELSNELNITVDPGFDAFVAKARITRKADENEWTYIRKDGTKFPVRLSVTALYEQHGDLFGYLGIAKDISETKQTQQELLKARNDAESANQVKSEFLANMSHEIRTPLNAIIGMTDLMQKPTIDSTQQQQYAQIIHQSGEALLAIINDVLDFSKIESGNMILNIDHFSLSYLVESQADILTVRAQEKNITLMTFISPHLPPELTGDSGRVGQILLNLIGNAIKFTQEGSVTVRVFRAQDSPQHSRSVKVRFEVQDTGIGLSQENQKKLFTPFTQASGAISQKFGGTGLGLSISKRLVEAMGGQIGVNSTENEGSLFWFEINFPISENALAFKTKEFPSEINQQRILIVDDDTASNEIISEYINSWNIKNNSISSFTDAISTLKQAVSDNDPYTIIIVGAGKYQKSGIKLAKDLPKLKTNIPKSILMTSFHKNLYKKSSLAYYFNQVVYKPIKQSMLYDAIINVVLNSHSTINNQSHPVEPTQIVSKENQFRILVADDIAANQILTKKLLENLGYDAITVANGLEVLQSIEQSQFDLILMDCQMPEMDGFEATRRIREIESKTGEHIPIIALTANAMSGDDKKCLASGMDDYLAKPIKENVLKEMMNKWLSDENKKISA